MDLYYLRGSPWSMRVAWAIACLPERFLKNTTLHNTGKADSLAPQVALAKAYNQEQDAQRETVSVPMLFYNNTEGEKVVIRDGVEIIEYLCESMSEEEVAESPFAQSFLQAKEEMKKWHDDTQMIMRYTRAKSGDVSDNVAQYFVPGSVSWIPFLTSSVNKKVTKYVKNKYYDIGISIPMEDMEAVFKAAEDRLQESDYLAGAEFSYADICLCAMLEFSFPFMVDPPLTNGALLPKTVQELCKLDWHNKFPKVMAHREKVFEHNFSNLALKVTKMKLVKKLANDPRNIWRKKEEDPKNEN